MAKLKELTLKMVIDNQGNIVKTQQLGEAFEKAEEQVRNMNNEVNRGTNALGNQTRATNLAGQSALEISRIASDAAYGMRGMANNIGQVATMTAQLAQQAPAGIGAMGRMWFVIQQTGAALMGPMGVIVAIQGLLSLFTLWESRSQQAERATAKLAKGVKSLTDQIGNQVAELRNLKDLLIATNTSEEAKITIVEKLKGALPGLTGEYRYQAESVDELINTVDKRIRQMEVETGLIMATQDVRETISKRDSYIKSYNTMMDQTVEKTGLSREAIQKLVDDGREWADYSEKYIFGNAAKSQSIKDLTSMNKRIQNMTTSIEVQTDAAKNLRAEWEGFQAPSSDGDDEEVVKRRERINEKLQYLDTIREQASKDLAKIFKDRAQEMKDEMADLGEVAIDIEMDYSSMYGNLGRMAVVWGRHLDGLSTGLDATGAILQSFSQIQGRENKKMFEVSKAFAIASITIDTYMAASTAYRQALPLTTPIGAALVAAGVVAQGLARVVAVQNQQFSKDSTLSGSSSTSTTTSQEDQAPVTTTGFSNLSGGENPGSSVKVYVLEHDVRTTSDKVNRTKVRSRL